MSLVEVVFRTRDNTSADGAWKSGMPIEVRSPGTYLSPDEMEAWFLNGQRPAALYEISRARAYRMRREIAECQYLLDPQIDIREACENLHPGMPLELATRKLEAAMFDCAQKRKFWREHGVDSNFSARELRQFGVALMDLTPREADDIVMPEYEPTGRMQDDEPGCRRYKLDFERVFSGHSAVDWMNPDLTVPVHRGKEPLGWTELVAKVG